MAKQFPVATPHLDHAMTTIPTRLTRMLGLQHPIVSAPMAFAAGGVLAAAVSRAGGLGLIGAGYGDPSWIKKQFESATDARVGVGFITWSLGKSPELLAETLRYHPIAVMLSFGDPSPFVREIHGVGSCAICQCQNMRHVKDAVNVGANIIVAQGAEAGGHGGGRGTLSFVPEVADYLASRAPETLLLAAGGIADGRGLAAALMLGADGVLIGTRFWASQEALVSKRHLDAILQTDGDGTLRTHLPDIVRGLSWPNEFTARVKKNAFTNRWHGQEETLRQCLPTEQTRYFKAMAEGDPENTAVWFGEAAGLIHSIDPVAKIIERIVSDAAARLGR